MLSEEKNIYSKVQKKLVIFHFTPVTYVEYYECITLIRQAYKKAHIAF